MGRMEVTVRRVRRREQLLDDLKEKILEFEKGTCSVQNSLCKKLYTSLKTDYGMNEKTIS